MEDTIARDPCQWFIFDPFWPHELENAKPPPDTGADPPAPSDDGSQLPAYDQ